MAPTRDYAHVLSVFHGGEVYGEAAFAALEGAARTPAEARCFQILGRLETQTRERLVPLLAREGLPISGDTRPAAVRAAVAGYLATSWRGYAAALAQRLVGMVAEYEILAGAAPPADAGVMAAVVAHERALLAFAQVAAQTDTPDDAALAPVLELLENPAIIA